MFCLDFYKLYTNIPMGGETDQNSIFILSSDYYSNKTHNLQAKKRKYVRSEKFRYVYIYYAIKVATTFVLMLLC